MSFDEHGGGGGEDGGTGAGGGEPEGGAGAGAGAGAQSQAEILAPPREEKRRITTSQELLHALARIGSPNHVGSGLPGGLGWGMLQVQLETPSLRRLRVLFADLNPSIRQVR